MIRETRDYWKDRIIVGDDMTIWILGITIFIGFVILIWNYIRVMKGKNKSSILGIMGLVVFTTGFLSSLWYMFTPRLNAVGLYPSVIGFYVVIIIVIIITILFLKGKDNK